jgi:hypothetical protein
VQFIALTSAAQKFCEVLRLSFERVVCFEAAITTKDVR